MLIFLETRDPFSIYLPKTNQNVPNPPAKQITPTKTIKTFKKIPTKLKILPRKIKLNYNIFQFSSP
jgi:hypothetical protein